MRSRFAGVRRDVEKIRDYIAAAMFRPCCRRRQADRCAAVAISAHPAPSLFHRVLDDVTFVGRSPEVLVRVEGDEVTVRPIAGTRPRGATPEEDAALAAALRGDEKELAEHRMLVDLGRNDIGRVAQYGSVHVTGSLEIERYSHVQHLVSEVRGTLSPGHDALDVFRACFPAARSGAPSARLRSSMSSACGGPYAAWLRGGRDESRYAHAIRPRCLGSVIAQAGAGIVADSIRARVRRDQAGQAALRAHLASWRLAPHLFFGPCSNC
jgi:anthranilate synthase component 1